MRKTLAAKTDNKPIFNSVWEMRKLLITIIFSILTINSWARTIEPIEKTVGKLRISIDPRMELLSAVQTLSNYKVLNRQLPYNKEIQTYFASSASHKAVTNTNDLLNSQGFSFDAPVAFMLHLSQPLELKQVVPYSVNVLKRVQNKEDLENYRASIAEFAYESKFAEFWKSKTEFYNKVIEATFNELAGNDLTKALEQYFNETQNSYEIIISPSFRGGYGPKIPSAKGKYDIYSCISTTDIKGGIPYVSKGNLNYYVWHEFGHSFVNPELEKYPNRVTALEKLFEPIKKDMSNLAYGNVSTCINELILRAVNVRLRSIFDSNEAATKLLNQELLNRFIYIEPIIKKLKSFEKERDTKHITFSTFYPQLLDVLDSLQKTDYSKLAVRKFLGPINLATMNQKVAIIFPTHDKDTVELNIAQKYATRIFNWLKTKSENCILLADTVALTQQLSDCGIMVYGTLESNLFLKHYKSFYPFKIENNILYADKEYKDADIKFITCVPNPQNEQKGMAIYTALSNKNIQDINNVFHGPEDFIIFTNRDNVSSKGFYDKTKTSWQFIK